jgi:hypothetical protein
LAQLREPSLGVTMPRQSRNAASPVGNGSVGVTQLRVEAAPQVVDVTLGRVELNRQIEELQGFVSVLQLDVVFALIAKRFCRSLVLRRTIGPSAAQLTEASHDQDNHHAAKAGKDEAVPYAILRILKNALDQGRPIHDTSNANAAFTSSRMVARWWYSRQSRQKEKRCLPSEQPAEQPSQICAFDVATLVLDQQHCLALPRERTSYGLGARLCRIVTELSAALLFDDPDSLTGTENADRLRRVLVHRAKPLSERKTRPRGTQGSVRSTVRAA